MDIKISLEIGLSPALEAFLGKTLGATTSPPRAAAAPAPVDKVVERAEEALAAAEVVVPQEDAPKRTRRTKAQMEADAAAATADHGDQDSAEDPASTSTTATTSASLSDALEATEGVTATKEQLRAATSAAMARIPGCAPKLQAAWMAEFGAEQKSSGSIAPENYARAIEIADTLA